MLRKLCDMVFEVCRCWPSVAFLNGIRFDSIQSDGRGAVFRSGR